MKHATRPLVIGNWKMHPQTDTLATKLAKELRTVLAKVQGVDVVVAPPFPYLKGVGDILGKKGVFLGAQNVHPQKLGAHTGEVSIPMLESLGVQYVILGHSERRAAGETDEEVRMKLRAVLQAGLVPVVCVGEVERDANGQYLSGIEAQIKSALKDIPAAKVKRVVIAYEPIWAIGTGNNATAADVREMALFIEKIVADLYGRLRAQKVTLLYGGSVNEKNARELFTEGKMQGFLVGGASLRADAFASIVKQTLA